MIIKTKLKVNGYLNYFLIFLLLLFVTPALKAQTPEDGPAVQTGHTGPIDLRMTLGIPSPGIPLDETVRKQLMYFLEIAGHIRSINKVDFFRPYNRNLKRKVSRLLQKAAAIEPDACGKQYLETLASQVPADRFSIPVPGWFSLEENRAEIIFLKDETHTMKVLLLHQFIPGRLRGNRRRFNSGTVLNTVNNTGDGGEESKIFDTFVYLNDLEETFKYREYTRRFGRMQDNLPYEAKPKVPFAAVPPHIKIARLVYSTADYKTSQVYPGPDVFYNFEGGKFKIVIFKNLVDAYVNCILKPISGEILLDPNYMGVDTDSYLSNLVMHKISHHIGPVFDVQFKGLKSRRGKKDDNRDEDDEDEQDEQDNQVEQDNREGDAEETGENKDYESGRGEETEVERQSQSELKEKELLLVSDGLGERFPASEELKSRIIALHNTSVLLEDGVIPPEYEINIYSTYLVSLIDRLRRDLDTPLELAHIVQFNYLLKNGAITFNINNRKLSIRPDQFAPVVEKLAEDVIKKFKSITGMRLEYGQIGPELKEILERLQDLPVKIETKFLPDTGNGGQ
ncbi:MAG: hypothetical protein GY940_29805 [bacterium]|nr:hypothetical protein [bacterium]